MKCNGCAGRVKEAIGGIEGVQKVDVSLSDQQVIVSFESTNGAKAAEAGLKHSVESRLGAMNKQFSFLGKSCLIEQPKFPQDL